MNEIIIKRADLTRPGHARVFTSLLSAYIHDPKGQFLPNAHAVEATVAENLSRIDHVAIFFAKMDAIHIGMAVCFWGFSTFRNRPLLNIHDLVVLPNFRRRGVARALLAHIETFAAKHQACKLTLEVRDDNEPAALLYSSFGFADEPVPMRFRTKYLG